MKSIKKTLIVLIVASIMAFGLTSCEKEVVVATVNNESVSEQVYRIFLWSTQRGLESIVPNFWDVDLIEGKTPKEFAKDSALKSINYNIAVKQKAEELDIKLTNEEKNEIKEAAKKYIASNKAFVETYNIKQKHFEEYLTYGKLKEKVIEKLGENYIPNVEELDEKVKKLLAQDEYGDKATIIQVLISNIDEQGETIPEDKEVLAKKKAEEVLQKALAGEDMGSLARQYSDDPAVTSNNGEYTFSKGTMDENLEKVVFEEAIEGQVYPKIISTEIGYEIVKVISISKASQDEIKAIAIKMIQSEFANHELTETSEMCTVEKTEVYDQIDIMKIEEEHEESSQ